MKIAKDKLWEMEWWDKDAKADHINSAAACQSSSVKNPFIKLPQLPKRKDVENKVLLDIGCGYGRTLIPLAKLKPKAAYGLDISSEMLRYCARYAKQNKVKLKLVNASLPVLPFKENSFDLIFSAAVLLHLPKADIPKTLQEIKRVLKPSGKFIFVGSFPNALNLNGASNWFPTLIKSKLTGKTIVPGMPKHYYLGELRTILQKSGLGFVIKPNGYELFPTNINRFRLPFKPLIKEVNKRFEPVLSSQRNVFFDNFFPRFFDVVGTKN